jgi:hypothetical protein
MLDHVNAGAMDYVIFLVPLSPKLSYSSLMIWATHLNSAACSVILIPNSFEAKFDNSS